MQSGGGGCLVGIGGKSAGGELGGALVGIAATAGVLAAAAGGGCSCGICGGCLTVAATAAVSACDCSRVPMQSVG